ncbi:MAG TPA: RDD family protein [Bacteroidia bacterium]|jgi:uncharacterized RDD family membrane protein YckC|nr:RDD family protein [Bacteroidia bacterium]
MEAAGTPAIDSTSTYATFWRRFAAFLIDSSLIHLLMLPFLLWYFKGSGFWDLVTMGYKAYKAGLFSGDNSMIIGGLFGSGLNAIVVLVGARAVFDLLYHGIWESSKFQATPGKMATHVKVVDENGNRLTLLRSLSRNLLKIISNITLLLGYLMALVTERHQALHDKISNCYVLKTSFPVPHMKGVQYAGFLRRLLAFVLDWILLFILCTPISLLFKGDEQQIQEFFRNYLTNPNALTIPSIDLLLHQSFLVIITIFINFFYYASFESSRLQATPGKIAIGIRVTDTLGQRLSFWMAAGRYVNGKFISNLTLGVGYLMIAYTPKAQALHDELADTMVVKSQIPME